ncbi:hypothetical protein A9P82_10385 [Arachidicoccus ginsenosidimutans]|uniref:beta-galactosidase n=1 Tax=Arachidicoccus sp. BS20 TaxID=1850526 RepID=UPI0007F11DB9|nr:beta-galactosidase [Arachidicoccus sp. BS20]ANI89659.1 hypothetical protein A9P82_10385 [Arachidicoccus sp. BS20]
MDSHGFIINGKRTFLVSAGLEYARMPRAQWKDRLLRLKRGGFNCVEFYTFWNFHEAQEGKFDFSGDHDLNAFLQLVKQMGMYAIARVGPYYCAEWDFGGYPHWLRQKEGMVVRYPDTQFEQYVDHFFGKLIPIIAANQINHGGSVIMVQLENEHPASWGTYIPNEYFSHLQRTALSLGIEVPYFFSGLHHGSDPAGNTPELYDPKRPNPWFTTEFWSVWFDKYGSDQKDADEYGRRTWKIISRGGGGYNYYMAYGGSNFGYTNDDEDAASYDYGAAVGQTGDLRPLYYQFKRNALFAESFRNILENCTTTAAYNNISTDSSIHINARTNEQGTLVFLDNKGKEPKTTQIRTHDGILLPEEGGIHLASGEIFPIVHRFKLTNDVAIDWAITRILGIEHSGMVTTIVVYGNAATPGEIYFIANQDMRVTKGKGNFEQQEKKLRLHFSFDEATPTIYEFTSDNETIRIVAVDTQLSDRTWFINENNIHSVIVGPEYLGDIQKSEEGYALNTEHFWTQKKIFPHIWAFDEKVKETDYQVPDVYHPDSLVFTTVWQMKDASIAAETTFDDSKWLKSENPLQMGADGDTTAYAWYRTRISAPLDDIYSLDISKGNGRYIVFIDGKKTTSDNIHHLQFSLSKGEHTLAIFATHDGRNKLVSYVGKLDLDEKGIAGEALLHKGVLPNLNHWQFVKAESPADSANTPSFADGKNYFAGGDAFHGEKGFGWFQTTFPKAITPDSIYFSDIDDNAIVYINGVRAGVHKGWGKSFSVPFVKGNADSNIITLFVENTDGSGGIGKIVKAVFNNDKKIKGWRMKGGLQIYSLKGWTNAIAGNTGVPTFFRNYFTIKDTAPNVKAMWRVSFKGLSHGFIWVNGHNLGRYPEKIPIDGLYIPECWLKEGKNEIMVFDEFGNTPDNISIYPEQQASRDKARIIIK